MKKKITILQADWLDKMGGRIFTDLKKDEKGLFVKMGNGYGKYLKIYLPSDEEILDKEKETVCG